MKRFVPILAALLSSTALALAQTQPATIRVDPTKAPEPVSILDSSGNWAAMGTIDPTAHAFNPLANWFLIPPGFGGIPEAVQTWYTRTLSSASYGDSDSTASDQCTTTAGSNVITLTDLPPTSSGDWKIGEGVLCHAAGPSFDATKRASNFQVSGAGSGSYTVEYAVTAFDQNNGYSTSLYATLTGVAAIKSNNPAILTATEPSRTLPIGIYRQITNGGVTGPWQWIGTATPTYSVALSSGGSGYTPGAYMWMASGGDCLYEPFGYLTVNASGVVSTISVTPYWHGCATVDPTFVMPPAAGAGSGVAVTMALGWQFVDGGVGITDTTKLPAQPNWVPSTPPVADTPGYLTGLVTAVNGNRLTISNNAGQTVVSTIRHEETVAVQNCLNAAALTGQPQTACALACGGTHNIAGNLIFNGPGTGLVGQSPTRMCPQISKYGAGDTLTNPAYNNTFLAYLRFLGTNSTSGWGFISKAPPGVAVATLQLDTIDFVNMAGGYSAAQVNGFRARHVYGAKLWGYSYSDFDNEGGASLSQIGCCYWADDLYSNDDYSRPDNEGGVSHRGVVWNGVATIQGTSAANSNAEGYGQWDDSTRVALSSNQSALSGQQAFFQRSFDSCENSPLESCFHVNHATQFFETNATVAGGTNGLFIGQSVASWSWIGGFIRNTRASCADIWGSAGSVVGVGLDGCGDQPGGTIGANPGLKLEPTAFNDAVSANHFGTLLQSAVMSYPIELESVQFAANGPLNGTVNITMATPNDGSVLPGMNAFDITTMHNLNTVLTYNGTALVLTAPPRGVGSTTSADVIAFSFGQSSVVGNNLAGATPASQDTVHDLSFNPTNRIGMNPGDTVPGWHWNNAQSLFAIGPTASYANNGSEPGLNIRFENDGADVRFDIVNASTAAQSTATLFFGTNIAGEFGSIGASNNAAGAGQPTMSLSAGPANGAVVVAAQGGYYGFGTPVQIEPYILPLGGRPTIVTGCGAGATITGTDMAGILLIGSGTVTSCPINFNTPHPTAPNQCQITPANAVAANTATTQAYVAPPTTTGWSVTGAALAGAEYSYACM
jgi:hypothetical protein